MYRYSIEALSSGKQKTSTRHFHVKNSIKDILSVNKGVLILVKSEEKYVRPLVSIIVTTYNRKDKLREALTSILEQSFDNLEIMVVDNFSDYDIKGFIKEFYDNRIVLIQNANNGNYVINRNLGIKESRGDYIAFLR